MPRASKEPEWTIYSAAWDEARSEAGRLSPAPYAAAYVAVLDFLEAGWAILRPLPLACEAIMRGPDEVPEMAAEVDAYVDADLIDCFRGIAFCWRDELVSPDGPHRSLLDTRSEAEYNLRLLRILAMGAENPAMPALIRPLLAPMVKAFAAWVDGFGPVVDAVLAVEDEDEEARA